MTNSIVVVADDKVVLRTADNEEGRKLAFAAIQYHSKAQVKVWRVVRDLEFVELNEAPEQQQPDACVSRAHVVRNPRTK